MRLTRWMATGVALAGLLLLASCLNTSDVKIGVIIPQEGSSLQEYGYQITSGIKLAEADLKAKGHLNKNYELIVKSEDLNNIESVKQAFMELKEAGVIAIIGAASSASTIELSKLANEHKIVLLSPAASSPEINSGDMNANDFVFRNQPSDTLEAQTLANLVFQKCRMQKVLMVRSKSAYAEGITFELLKFGRQNRNQIPGEVVKFSTDTANVDYVSVTDRIIEHAPPAVFVAGYHDEVLPLIEEIRRREELTDTYVFTSSALLIDNAMTKLGAETLEGLMYTSYPWEPAESGPVIQSFAQRFQQEYKTKPDIYAANGYDAMIVLATAIELADHWLTDALRDELNKINFTPKTTSDLILQETDFNKRGDVTRIPQVYWVHDGLVAKLQPEDIDAIKEKILTQF